MIPPGLLYSAEVHTNVGDLAIGLYGASQFRRGATQVSTYTSGRWDSSSHWFRALPWIACGALNAYPSSSGSERSVEEAGPAFRAVSATERSTRELPTPKGCIHPQQNSRTRSPSRLWNMVSATPYPHTQSRRRVPSVGMLKTRNCVEGKYGVVLTLFQILLFGVAGWRHNYACTKKALGPLWSMHSYH